MNDNEFLDESELPKSKSQIKREMTELQVLGGRLVLLNNQQLKTLELPTLLLQAINEAKKITSRSATRRQLQYIGRLMRDLEDTSFILEFFEKLEMKHQRTNAIYHMLEAWREKLLSDDLNLMTQFIEQFPNVDRQRIRQLVQNGKKERLTGKPVGASKLLFKYIKEVVNESEIEDKN